jgi:DNA-binding HxlR family transcriptional regulator
MQKYGQYCPAAKALEVVGDRWTLLIVRDMLKGYSHFNELERNLPGISRSLLASRLRHLQESGLIEKRINPAGRRTTGYFLTQAGYDLLDVINALVIWGAKWAFDEPTPEELDPVLLMWWMRSRVNVDQLPAERVVVQFDFHGAETAQFWLVMTVQDVTVCLTDPGYEIGVLVTADLSAYFQLWAGRIRYHEAISEYGISVEGMPQLVRAFPNLFAWSHSADDVHSARTAARMSDN